MSIIVNETTITDVVFDGITITDVIVNGLHIFGDGSSESYAPNYILQNGTWTIDVSGTVLNSGWNKESGVDGWGLYTYGMCNDTNESGSWSTLKIPTNGSKTVVIKLSDCQFGSGGYIGLRNRSISTDTIHTINTIGTHKISLPENCESLQIYTWLESGSYIYIDEIYFL